MKIPQLVAHRGYPEHYPENTLVGLAAAIQAGARFVEIDLQLTSDQTPVLLHDRSLARVCGVDTAVHQLTAEQLQQLSASEYERFGYRFAQERIATLSAFVELLRRHPGVKAFVELKRSSLEHFGPMIVLSRILRELGPVLERTVLISFDLDVLLAARRQQVPAVGAIINKWGERKHPLIRELRPDYLLCDVEGLPRWGALPTGGARLVVYEITDPALALRLAARGALFIETFAIGEMLEELELFRAAR